MAARALDVRDHAHTAGIVFISRVIKTLGSGMTHHGKVPSCQMLLQAMNRASIHTVR